MQPTSNTTPHRAEQPWARIFGHPVLLGGCPARRCAKHAARIPPTGQATAVPLEEYRRKRDPTSTPEPFEADGSGSDGRPIFVVQRHDARRLHYDFRLERNGALASWAVPKGVPLEPGEQRLAVHVEDHPLSYATFEGQIPAGEYGAGSVEIWDHGTYELVEEKRDGGLTVRLHGERLEGLWTLVPAKLSGDEKNWLLLKKRETGTRGLEPRPPARRTAPRYDPMLATLANLPEHPQSVPINQLVQVKGTPLEGTQESGQGVDGFEFVRTIAVARILMPQAQVRLSAGREAMSDELQALAFLAGANSIFYGEKLLTTGNPDVARRLSEAFQPAGLNTWSFSSRSPMRL